jgi:murein DD-endopeptidase MepM/ murein hydrolase activator NlpD
VADAEAASWAEEHHDYPATDIFVGCGAQVVSPVDATLLEVRTVDGYDPQADNPALRGGKSISLLGTDGVRYYLAHFDQIVDGLAPGGTVTAGQPLGEIGRTGRASACHLHFAISPPCPGKEWAVRRGVIWPYPYLDAWRGGEQRSPATEVSEWTAAHPDACAEAIADPNAPDA